VTAFARPFRFPQAVSACVLAAFVGMASAQTKTDARHVIGWVEKVGVTQRNFVLDGKMDTGADNSSLHALQQEVFEREGAPWVRFQVQNPEGQTLSIEQPVVKTARIKRHDGGMEQRWVIQLGLCIGRQYKVVDVNLVSRDRYTYPLLVGRSFLQRDFIVDSSLRYTVEPACDGK